MKKKQKQKIALGISVLVLVLLFLNFSGFLSQLYPSSGTLYNSWSVDLDKLELTYSDTSTEDLRANAFKSLHSLHGGLSNDFHNAELNKRFWRFFLKVNDVNPNNFRDYSGRVLSGVFMPINWESIASRIWDESDNAYKYVAYSPVGEDIEKIQELGFYWDYRGPWSGGYRISIMSDMASKMACYVEGETTALAEDIYIKSDRSEPFVQSYKIYGDASFDGNSFICQVDTRELFDELPRIFVRPSDGANVSVGGVGVDGEVVFYFGERIYQKYRLENNQCFALEIELSEITLNDYSTLSECESQIINYIDIYRIENNHCIRYNIDENEITNLEYINLPECQSNLIELQTYYRFQNEMCTEISILPSEALGIDYSTLEDCEVNLPEDESLFWDYKYYIIIIIILILLIIFGGFYKKKN